MERSHLCHLLVCQWHSLQWCHGQTDWLRFCNGLRLTCPYTLIHTGPHHVPHIGFLLQKLVAWLLPSRHACEFLCPTFYPEVICFLSFSPASTISRSSCSPFSSPLRPCRAVTGLTNTTWGSTLCPHLMSDCPNLGFHKILQIRWLPGQKGSGLRSSKPWPKVGHSFHFQRQSQDDIKEFTESTLGNLSENCWENKVNQ